MPEGVKLMIVLHAPVVLFCIKYLYRYAPFGLQLYMVLFFSVEGLYRGPSSPRVFILFEVALLFSRLLAGGCRLSAGVCGRSPLLAPPL